jgi:hypothetical protein
MTSEWQLAKYGEHLLSCPVCSPVDDRYCATAIELLRILWRKDVDKKRPESVIRLRQGA